MNKQPAANPTTTDRPVALEHAAYLRGAIEALDFAMRLLLAHESHLAALALQQILQDHSDDRMFMLADAWALLHAPAPEIKVVETGLPLPKVVTCDAPEVTP